LAFSTVVVRPTSLFTLCVSDQLACGLSSFDRLLSCSSVYSIAHRSTSTFDIRRHHHRHLIVIVIVIVVVVVIVVVTVVIVTVVVVVVVVVVGYIYLSSSLSSRRCRHLTVSCELCVVREIVHSVGHSLTTVTKQAHRSQPAHASHTTVHL